MKREEFREVLVTRMMDANFKASKTPYTYPPNMCEGMSAALDVAVAELLGELTVEESQVALKDQAEYERTVTERHKYTFTHSIAQRVIANRRSRLSKPKSFEERVTVDGCRVFIDGVEIASAVNDATACMIMTGLVAQFKAGEK